MFELPETVDLQAALFIVYGAIGQVVMIALGGWLAFRLIRRGLAWANCAFDGREAPTPASTDYYEGWSAADVTEHKQNLVSQEAAQAEYMAEANAEGESYNARYHGLLVEQHELAGYEARGYVSAFEEEDGRIYVENQPWLG